MNERIQIKTTIVMSALFALFSLYSQTPFVDIHTCRPRFIKQKKKQFCFISFVTINGVKYLVKQKRYPGYLMSAVYDTFASYIAESLDSAIAHKVILIPSSKSFPGKKYDLWPATLHTLVSGKTLKEKRSPYRKMNIKQADQGFTRNMIVWMAKHKQLVKILALDIFLCNHDRHRGNLFYDAKKNKFCAIDMDLLFEHGLGASAYSNLKRMIDHGLFPLTVKEALALLELRNALEFLVTKHDPEGLIVLFDNLVQEAGLVKGSFCWTASIQNEINVSKSRIRSNYRDVQKVIDLLDDIVKQVIAEQPFLHMYSEVDVFVQKMRAE